MINLEPKICNICGGKVEFIEKKALYGGKIKYKTGSPYCYHCKQCGATVGTHKERPREAMGLLANKEMADMRQKAHSMFDKFWRSPEKRTKCYQRLAEEMGIPIEECHFAYFTLEQLEQAYTILVRWWRERYDK